jgi:prepilin-type N-terminal cleavage/methylation domain-containing protein
MNIKKRGFTLIELLVVIAIIGILSSVVLASLNTARNKGSDAAIKSNVNNARAQAELYYDNNGQSYAGLCAAASSATPGGILTMRTGATSAGSAAVACNDSSTQWAFSAQLKTTTSIYFCADYRGLTSTSTTALGANTQCP